MKNKNLIQEKMKEDCKYYIEENKQ